MASDDYEAPPFRSLAQRRKWEQFVGEGRITQAQFDARAKATGTAPLPERAAPRIRTVGASRAPAEAKLNDRRY